MRATWELWPLCFACQGNGFVVCQENGEGAYKCMHSAGDYVYTGMNDGAAIAWDIHTGEEVRKYVPSDSPNDGGRSVLRGMDCS